MVARANRGATLDYGIGADPGAGADADLGADYRAGSDFDAGVELGMAVDDGARMDVAGYGAASLTSIADNSASATSSPSTRASACIFHNGR